MPTTQVKELRNLPFIMQVNCGALGEDELKLWRSKDQYFKFEDVTLANCWKSFTSFLPLQIKIHMAKNGVFVTEMNPFDQNDESSSQKGDTDNIDGERESAIYELTSMICQIENGQDPNHLVAFIRVPFNDEKNSPILADMSNCELTGVDYPWRWYLFNDFLVKEVTPHEAVQFKSRCKIPAVLQFTRMDIKERSSLSGLKRQFDKRVITDVDDRYGTASFSCHTVSLV